MILGLVGSGRALSNPRRLLEEALERSLVP